MPELLDPARRISQETLDEMDASVVPPSGDAIAAFAALDDAGLRRITDAATADVVNGLSGLGELPDGDRRGVDPETCTRLALRAGKAGYLSGRMLLGTVYETVQWSAPDEDRTTLAADTRAVDGTMLPLPGPWGLASCDLIEMLTAHAGLTIDDESHPVAELTFRAFDAGTTVALLEHDRWKGRTPA